MYNVKDKNILFGGGSSPCGKMNVCMYEKLWNVDKLIIVHVTFMYRISSIQNAKSKIKLQTITQKYEWWKVKWINEIDVNKIP